MCAFAHILFFLLDSFIYFALVIILGMATEQSNEKWQSSLRAGIPLSGTKIICDRLHAPISLIAKQFYCELQLDHELKLGKVLNSIEEEGTELHEKILKSEGVELEEIIESIENESYYKCSFPVYAQVNNLIISGYPDCIIFKDSKPIYLFELKTTFGDSDRVYRNQEIQIQAYGFALESMGFDCSELNLYVVIVDRNVYIDDEEFVSEIINNKILSRDLGIENKIDEEIEELIIGVKFHSILFNRDKIIKELTRASKYWLMERDPISTDNYGKCMICNYECNCSHSFGKGKSKKNTFEKIRLEYPKAYKKWTEKEDNQLKNQFAQSETIDNLAKHFERKPSAIYGHLQKLGIIRYLFTWENVPGNDSDRLLDYLKSDLEINLENAEIIKADDDKSIQVFSQELSVEIMLDDNKDTAVIKIGESQFYDLHAKKQNGKVSIYITASN